MPFCRFCCVISSHKGQGLVSDPWQLKVGSEKSVLHDQLGSDSWQVK